MSLSDVLQCLISFCTTVCCYVNEDQLSEHGSISWVYPQQYDIVFAILFYCLPIFVG